MGRWKNQSTKPQETNLNDTKGWIFPIVDSWKLLKSLITPRSRPWPRAENDQSNLLMTMSLKGSITWNMAPRIFFMQIKCITNDNHLMESSQNNVHPRENFMDAVKEDMLKQYIFLIVFLKFSSFLKKKNRYIPTKNIVEINLRFLHASVYRITR